MLTSIIAACVAGYLGFLAAGLFAAVKIRDLKRAYLRLAEAVDESTIRLSFAPDDSARALVRQQISRLEQALRESDQEYGALA